MLTLGAGVRPGSYSAPDCWAKEVVIPPIHRDKTNYSGLQISRTEVP
jgi:hypothetical protein